LLRERSFHSIGKLKDLVKKQKRQNQNAKILLSQYRQNQNAKILLVNIAKIKTPKYC